MTWNFDITEAPRGKTVTRKVGKAQSDAEFHEREYIIAASIDGVVTRSYWIPKEERWCMFSKAKPPVAWQPWPEHPNTEGQQ